MTSSELIGDAIRALDKAEPKKQAINLESPRFDAYAEVNRMIDRWFFQKAFTVGTGQFRVTREGIYDGNELISHHV